MRLISMSIFTHLDDGASEVTLLVLVLLLLLFFKTKDSPSLFLFLSSSSFLSVGHCALVEKQMNKESPLSLHSLGE